MQRVLFLLFSVMFHMPILSQNNQYINNEEKQALEYLNKVRNNASKYSSEIGVNLSYIDRKPSLTWNSILAKVAQEKAEDMARRNYFSHTDLDNQGINILIHKQGYNLPHEWIKKKNTNYFESLGAGYSGGVEAIKDLIKDEGVNPPGHRNHLLGITDFWSNCYDVGIGFVYKEDINEQASYPTYICIIIAKKNW